jgi:hypothetical protein
MYGQQEFGLKFGSHVSTTKDLIANPKNKLGWAAGVYFEAYVAKNIFFRPEILFSTKGHRTKYENGGDSKSVTRLNYLNAPLLVGYRIDHRTSFALGPEIGYLLSAQLKYSSNFLNVSKNYPSKVDFGFDLDLNYQIIKHLSLAIRYSYGFNTLYSVDALGNRYTNMKGANRVFQVSANYSF